MFWCYSLGLPGVVEVGLAGDVPLLVRVGGVNRVVYVRDLHSMSRYDAVIEVLGFDLKEFTLRFYRVNGVREVEVDYLYSLGATGGDLIASGSQRVYVIDSDGGLKVKHVSLLKSSDALVSFIRGVFDSGRDEFRWLRGKVTRGSLGGVVCGSHEWSDVSPSKLELFNPLSWAYEEHERGGRARRGRVRRCSTDLLRVCEFSWLSRLEGFPSTVARAGRRFCATVTYKPGRSRDSLEKVPLEPFLKLKRILKKSRQVEAVRHIIGHQRMKFLSKKVASLALIHMLCGGLPPSVEGVPGVVLRNIAMLVFSDIVAVRLAEVKRLNVKTEAYEVEVEGEAFFAGTIPILVAPPRPLI